MRHFTVLYAHLKAVKNTAPPCELKLSSVCSDTHN